MSDNDVYASLSTPEADSDGTYTIVAGGQARVSGEAYNSSIYLLGNGKVQVVASTVADCPFKVAPVSGGVKEVSGASSYTLNNAINYPIMRLNLYGKSTQGGTPTPENPVEIVSVGDNGNVDITACGKNLLNGEKIIYQDNGIIITTENGKNYINGRTTSFVDLYFENRDTNLIKKLKQIPDYVTMSNNIGANNYFYDGNNYIKNKSISKNIISAFIRIGKDMTFDNNELQIQIEKGDTATDFEPYKGNTASITSSLPLCGIPVSEGGNYTDSNGQQWICDELIYNADGSGKITKQTAKIDSYNGESIATPYISTTGSLTTGATVIYQLATPQEIELTVAEMSALRQLQTFEGVSNITNGSGADMDVKICTNKMLAEYVNPITTGLQKQINELKSAVLSLGGNV